MMKVIPCYGLIFLLQLKNRTKPLTRDFFSCVVRYSFNCGQFSIIYFRGLGLRIRVRAGLGFVLGLGLGFGLVWCYGQCKFRVRVRIRVRVGFGL